MASWHYGVMASWIEAGGSRGRENGVKVDPLSIQAGRRGRRYVVDLHVDEQVVATSGAIALAEGGMAFTQVGGIAAQPSTIDDRKGGLFWTAVGAGVGGALGLVAIATDRDDCEKAESQCPAVPIFTTTIGALVGLLIGL